jgi:guanine deaminase
MQQIKTLFVGSVYHCLSISELCYEKLALVAVEEDGTIVLFRPVEVEDASSREALIERELANLKDRGWKVEKVYGIDLISK